MSSITSSSSSNSSTPLSIENSPTAPPLSSMSSLIGASREYDKFENELLTKMLHTTHLKLSELVHIAKILKVDKYTALTNFKNLRELELDQPTTKFESENLHLTAIRTNNFQALMLKETFPRPPCPYRGERHEFSLCENPKNCHHPKESLS